MIHTPVATGSLVQFNQPYYAPACRDYVHDALSGGSLFRDGYYKACVDFFAGRFRFRHLIPTASCTSALELTARLLDLCPGDEVIVPAYTYVSTANAFASFGARIVLADSEGDHPNMDLRSVEKLITPRTRAIVLVHYGGVSCDMEGFRALVKDRGIVLIEDAAHGIGCVSDGVCLGSLGDFATFSFHETKNITCGQGGMLVINNEHYIERALLLKENGTNRDQFIKGLASKYIWLDVGSTYNLPELSCALLYGNLMALDEINEKRKSACSYYHRHLSSLDRLAAGDDGREGNGHLFYLVTKSGTERSALMKYLREQRNIQATSHYIGLHLTPYYQENYPVPSLPHAERFTDCLLRLPMHYQLTASEQDRVIEAVLDFFGA